MNEVGSNGLPTLASKPMYMRFSVDTGLMMRTDVIATTPFGEIPVISTINSYSDYDGYKFANSISLSQDGNRLYTPTLYFPVTAN